MRARGLGAKLLDATRTIGWVASPPSSQRSSFANMQPPAQTFTLPSTQGEPAFRGPQSSQSVPKTQVEYLAPASMRVGGSCEQERCFHRPLSPSARGQCAHQGHRHRTAHRLRSCSPASTALLRESPRCDARNPCNLSPTCISSRWTLGQHHRTLHHGCIDSYHRTCTQAACMICSHVPLLRVTRLCTPVQQRWLASRHDGGSTARRRVGAAKNRHVFTASGMRS